MHGENEWSGQLVMDGVGRVIGKDGEPPEAEGARTRQRDSLFMIARLQLGDATATIEVRVRNLSPGGLMIELDRAVLPGAPVSLEMRGLGKVTGTVAWCTRGRVGIAFDAPIDPKRARKPIGVGVPAPEYVRPAVTTRRPRR